MRIAAPRAVPDETRQTRAVLEALELIREALEVMDEEEANSSGPSVSDYGRNGGQAPHSNPQGELFGPATFP
jgi:hypothetical protein